MRKPSKQWKIYCILMEIENYETARQFMNIQHDTFSIYMQAAVAAAMVVRWISYIYARCGKVKNFFLRISNTAFVTHLVKVTTSNFPNLNFIYHRPTERFVCILFLIVQCGSGFELYKTACMWCECVYDVWKCLWSQIVLLIKWHERWDFNLMNVKILLIIWMHSDFRWR